MAGRAKGRKQVTYGMEISGAEALEKRAAAAVRDARVTVPVKSGKLKASLKMEKVFVNGHPVSKISMAWYGRLVESGRKGRKPTRGEKGRFTSWGTANVAPKPFLKPAVFKHLGAVL